MPKKAPKAPPKPYSRERIEREAEALYRTTEGGRLANLSADARALSKRARRETVSILAGVYWRLAGEADPIPGKSPTARRNALVRRRASGVRFEILAGSLGASLGRRVSVSEIRRLLSEGGLDPDTSYSGRGTRKSRAGEATRTVEKTA